MRRKPRKGLLEDGGKGGEGFNEEKEERKGGRRRGEGSSLEGKGSGEVYVV